MAVLKGWALEKRKIQYPHTDINCLNPRKEIENWKVYEEAVEKKIQALEARLQKAEELLKKIKHLASRAAIQWR